MSAARFSLALALLSLAPAASLAQLRSRSHYTVVAAEPAIVEKVAANRRDAVAAVMRQPTLATSATESTFAANHKLYAWMLDNPDRVSLAWQRLEIPCVEIQALGNNRFCWTDPNGSRLSWEPVARIEDGVVWYATGQVKPGALFPMVPVKAVAVLRYPGTATVKPDLHNLKPELKIYLQTDSRAASAVLRILGPTAPKLAEDAAGQLLYFFSGIAGHLGKHPAQTAMLLGPK